MIAQVQHPEAGDAGPLTVFGHRGFEAVGSRIGRRFAQSGCGGMRPTQFTKPDYHCGSPIEPTTDVETAFAA